MKTILTTDKKCRACQESKPRTAEFFYRLASNKDGLDSRCKKCDNTRVDNRDRARYRGMKSGPCVDCHNTYQPCQMSFDHRDGTDKKFDISQMKSYSAEAFRIEIEKCDLVCLNCHALRTWVRAKDSHRLKSLSNVP